MTLHHPSAMLLTHKQTCLCGIFVVVQNSYECLKPSFASCVVNWFSQNRIETHTRNSCREHSDTLWKSSSSSTGPCPTGFLGLELSLSASWQERNLSSSAIESLCRNHMSIGRKESRERSQALCVSEADMLLILCLPYLQSYHSLHHCADLKCFTLWQCLRLDTI